MNLDLISKDKEFESSKKSRNNKQRCLFIFCNV